MFPPKFGPTFPQEIVPQKESGTSKVFPADVAQKFGGKEREREGQIPVVEMLDTMIVLCEIMVE